MTGNHDACSFRPSRQQDYSIGVVRLRLESTVPAIIDEFGSLYRGLETGDAHSRRMIRMQVCQSPDSRLGRRRYLIYGDGQAIGRERRHSEVLPFLEWGINARVMETHHEHLQVHAASLSRHGLGCIFAGTSGVGKSTIAAGLLAAGWEYFCDEFALINPATQQLLPFPKALCIKSGAFPVVKRLDLPLAGRRHYVKGLKGKVAYVNPADAGARCTPSPAPVRYVFFPRYTSGATPRLRPISRARAAFELSRGVLNRHAFDERALSVLAHVVRQAECYTLDAGEIFETSRLIDSVVCRKRVSPRSQHRSPVAPAIAC